MDLSQAWESASPIKSLDSEWDNALPLEEEKKKKLALGETASQAGSDFVSGLMRSLDTLKADNPQTVPIGTVPSRPDNFKEFVQPDAKPQQEDMPIGNELVETIKHLFKLPSEATQYALSNHPTKSLDKTLGGIATGLDVTYETASKRLLTPAVNSIAGTNDNFMNTSVNPYLEQRRKESNDYIKDSPFGEIGAMASEPYNVLLGGTGGVLAKLFQGLVVGGLIAERNAANDNREVTPKELAVSGLTMGLLGGGHALLKGKEAPKVEATRTEGMTPEESTIAQNLAKQFEEAKPIKDEYTPQDPIGERRSMDDIKEMIRNHDRGGEEQAKLFEAQMQGWADGENLKRKEQGLEPNVTAEDMANTFLMKYENKAKPTDAELKVLFDTVTDTDGNVKTIEQRNKSNGWQDVTSTDQYAQEYTRRMAGERGLESEFRTDTKTLTKLKNEGYEALTPQERAMVDNDIDTIRNHPDFRDENQVLADNGELFQFVGDKADEKDLIVQHNLSADNLHHALKNGGLAVPSLAITKKDTPLTWFGEITLIGDKELANPKGKSGTRVFGADIYSPRHPREEREYKTADIRKMDKSLEKYSRILRDGSIYDSRDIKDLYNNRAMQMKFLEEEKGIKVDIPTKKHKDEESISKYYPNEYAQSLQNKGIDFQELARDKDFQAKVYKDLADKLQERGNKSDPISHYGEDGFFNIAMDRAQTIDAIGRNNGKPDFYAMRDKLKKEIEQHEEEYNSYVEKFTEPYEHKSYFYADNKKKAYTQDTVLKYLVSNLRGGENWNYGAGNVRAMVTPEFKSIEEIKKAKSRLTTPKEFEAIKESLNAELIDIAHEISSKNISNQFTATDIATEFIQDYAKRGRRAISDYDVNAKPENLKRIDAFLNKLKEAPTEYFEAKITRMAQPSEFKSAVVPDNASQKTLEALEKQGLSVKKYKSGDEADRARAIKEASEENDLLFKKNSASGDIKGSYNIDQKLITLFESHDVSTLNHELGHRFYFTLSTKERGIIHEVFGVKGEWKVEHHEAFADAYARYIAEGKTTHTGLRAIFEKMKAFTKEILLKLKENNGGKMPPLSKEAREFFAAVMGDEKARKDLMERYKAKDAGVIGEGELFQTSSRLKEWHKDSHPLTKNADGTPKVFYHGTTQNFDTFRDGLTYVTDNPNYAEMYTQDGVKGAHYVSAKEAKFRAETKADGGNILPLHVKAKNVFDPSTNKADKKVFDDYDYNYGNRSGLNDGKVDWTDADGLKEYFDEKGLKYDAIVLKDAHGEASLAVFDPTQIKSIHNRGTFDETNPNILYQIPQNLLAPDQRPTLGDDIAKFKEGYTKVKEVLGKATEAFRDMTPDYYKELLSDRFTAIANLHDRAELIHKSLIKLSPETNKILQQAITGDIKTLPQGYQTLQPLVTAIRAELNAMSKKLVDSGMLDKETADAYKETYLKRSYEGHWAERNGDIQSSNDTGVKQIIGRGKEVKTDNPDEILSFVDDYLVANNKNAMPTMMDIADIKDYLTQKGYIGDSIVDGKIVWKEENGKITLRRDWSKDERVTMKEIENASLTVPNTILSMGTMLHNSELMKDLSGYTQSFKNIDEARANGFEQIPNTPRYGLLAGLYVDKHVADQVKYSFEKQNEIFAMYQKALSVWKQGKTVFNPTSHFNNFTSNILTQFMLGRDIKEAVAMMAESAKMVKEFPTKIAKYEEMRTRDYIGMLTASEKAEFNTLKSELKYYIEGKENGLFGRGQITDILKGFDPIANSFGNKGIATKGIEAVQKAYQRGDDIPRLASYKVLRESGMNAKDAKAFVTALYPDYSKPLPKGVRFLRDTGLSPFISWSYYVLPNLAKLVKQHPTRAAALMATIYVGSYLVSGINPFGDDIPDKEQGRRIPISSDGTTLKVDRMIAGSDFGAIPMDIISKVAQGANKGDIGRGVNDAVNATGRNVGKLAQNYLYGGVAQLVGDLVTNKDSYSGRSISGDTSDATKGAYNYLKHIAGFAAPAPLANIGGILENEINPKAKKKHSDVVPRTNTQELLKQIGLNTQTYNTDEVRRKRFLEDKKLIKESAKN